MEQRSNCGFRVRPNQRQSNPLSHTNLDRPKSFARALRHVAGGPAGGRSATKANVAEPTGLRRMNARPG